MIIKIKKTWKDFVEGPKHESPSRRDFIARGLQTGAMAVALPKAFGLELIKSAAQLTVSCPVPSKVPGAIAQIYAVGGPTMGARFFSEYQASIMNSGMAALYGITGTNLIKLGPGLVVDSTSVFGKTLMLGPPGFPGGATAWQSNVLGNVSAGGHLGPFNADDGAGVNLGMIGSVSLDKISSMGKDLSLNPGPARATWTNGTPSLRVSNPNTTTILAPFALHPAAAGYTTNSEMKNAADGAISIAQAASPMFGTATRKGGPNMFSSAGCAFYGNAALTDPNYANGLFNPTSITGLTQNITVASLTSAEQALLAAYYQSASGVLGGVSICFNQRDYHGKDPQTEIAPADMEDARAIVMFLAACYSAKQPGAMIYVANGQAVAGGTQSVTATINGTMQTMNCPIALGDSGGSYNGGLIMFYSPSGPGGLPTAKYTGTIEPVHGNVTMDANVASAQNAVAGLYLSAHKFISGTIPNSLVKRLQAANLAANPSQIMII
jgi:hypothetical protein